MSTFRVDVVKLGPLEKHPNADSLSITKVFDFPVICRTEDWKEGDLAAYVPVDAVVPVTPDFEFIHGGAGDIRHRRIKAKRLRGIFSMGFLHPCPCGFGVTDDVQEVLGIIKYEPPPPKAYSGGGQQAPEVPGFPRYTDIENILRYNTILQPGELVVATEKIHGANFRCGWINGDFHVGSHSCFRRDSAEGFSCKRCQGTGTIVEDVYDVDDNKLVNTIAFTCDRCLGEGRIKDFHDSGQSLNLWWRAVEQYNLKEKLSVVPGHLLFGEVYGAVQDLQYGVEPGEIKFAAFDVFRALTPDDVPEVIHVNNSPELMQWGYRDFYSMTNFLAELEIPGAPVLYEGPFDMDTIKEISIGNETVSGKGCHMREGVVVRPVKERDVYHFGRAILKVINPEYLLRKNGTEGQ